MGSSKVKYFSIFILLFLLGLGIISPILGFNDSNTFITNVNSKTKEVPIKFSHTEDFSIDVEKTQTEAENFNGSEFLNELIEFSQSELDVFRGSDVISESSTVIPGSGDLYYLYVNITESYIM